MTSGRHSDNFANKTAKQVHVVQCIPRDGLLFGHYWKKPYKSRRCKKAKMSAVDIFNKKSNFLAKNGLYDGVGTMKRPFNKPVNKLFNL
jgi:hypothetical protein